MAELGQVPVRIHRVTTRRRNLRTLQCPLEPELLVAEFAGELPPDVALAVREHIAVCEACGSRSQALRQPYELLASLGSEPVPYVPDLRDTVRTRVRRKRLYRGAMRVFGIVGRGGALGFIGVIGLAVLAVFLVAGLYFTVGGHSVTRSANSLTGVPSAGSGTLFVETDKLIAVKDSAGHAWQLAEVLAVSEHTGAVLHSLPDSSATPQTASKAQLPVAVVVAPDGATIYELTARDAHGNQALVAFDAATGKLVFATPLALPGAERLPAGQAADALALAPGGLLAYVGLNTPEPTSAQPRILLVDIQNGFVTGTLAPTLTYKIPMPPPPGSLPVSIFPSAVPILDAHIGTFTLGAGGSLAVSPDNLWLYDVLNLTMPDGTTYAVVRRFGTAHGATRQELALAGDFSLARMALAGSEKNLRLVLAQGSPNAQVYVLDPGTKGPTLLDQMPLGGPPALSGTTYSGMLALDAGSDTSVFVAQNVASGDGSVQSQDLWLVDVVNGVVRAHLLGADAGAAGLPNPAADGGPAFILRGGQVLLIAPDLSGSMTPWLSLSDGHPVIALVGARA
ncbi:MAG TPA: hypothetical protein VF116_13580 [Ktedonobacterales bacterium]